MSITTIEWTDRVWNCLRGCSHCSEGCRNCFAEAIAERFSGSGLPFEGFAVRGKGWTRKIELIDDKLLEPLSWKKPSRIFVNSMSDFGHQDLPDWARDRMLAVMLLAPHHTFQVLTKRAANLRRYLSDPQLYDRVLLAAAEIRRVRPRLMQIGISNPATFPAPWIWWGVSVEDQETADKRIPDLLRTPAGVRFISAEPLLDAIDLRAIGKAGRGDDIDALTGWVTSWGYKPRTRMECGMDAWSRKEKKLDLVIVGGESGNEARRCNVEWIRRIVAQCKEMSVACFVKQLGANVVDRNDAGFDGQEDDAWDLEMDFDRIEENIDGHRDDYQGAPVRIHLRDRKGGTMDEWPKDLRVRRFPEVGV